MSWEKVMNLIKKMEEQQKQNEELLEKAREEAKNFK